MVTRKVGTGTPLTSDRLAAMGAAYAEVLAKEYEDRFLNPFVAASRGYIDDVIRPHSTRWRIARALRMLRNKQVPHVWKKHDNIPL